MRGDVHRLKSPRDSRGHEQQGTRFAVILQSDDLPLSTVLVAPTSTSARPTSFRPEITVRGQRTHVLVEQTTAVDPSLLGPLVRRLSRAELHDVSRALTLVLSLD